MFNNFIYSLIFGLLVYGLGHILSSFISSSKENEKKSFFFESIIGIIFCLVVFSILKSAGNTIFTGLLILIIVYFYITRNTLKVPKKEDIIGIDYKSIMIYGVSVFLFSLIIHYVVFPDITLIHNDFFYFGAIADYLRIYGIESNSLNIDTNNVKPNLYHYSNEWLAALISTLTRNNGTTSLIYIYFPSLLGLLYIGLLLLTKRFSRFGSPIIFVLPFLFFIIGPIAGGGNIPNLFCKYNFCVSMGHYFSTPVIKFILIVILLIWFILVSNEFNDTKVIFIFLMVTFIWPTTTISIYGGVFIYIIFQRFFYSNLMKNEIILLAVSVLYILSFYFLQPDKEIIHQSSGSYLNRLIAHLQNDTDIRLYFKYFFGTAAIRIYYYLIIILIIVINKNVFSQYKNKILRHKQHITLYVFILFSGLVGKSFLYFMTDSNQIFENLFDHTFMYLVSFLVVIVALKTKYNIVFVLLFLITTVFTYSKEVEIKKKEVSKSDFLDLNSKFKLDNHTFATHVKAEGGLFDHISQVVYPPLTELRGVSNSYFPVNLSLFDRFEHQYSLETDITKKDRFKSLMSKSAYYQFVMSSRLDGTKPEVKINYLRVNKIDYLVYEVGSLNQNIFDDLPVIERVQVNDNVVMLKFNW